MGKIGIPNGIEGGSSNGTLGKFEDETTITKVIFGDNCTFVGNDAFENCTSLSEINKNNVIEEIGSNAFAGTAITSAKFDSLTKLGYGAFKGCINLNDIELGFCSSIGESAFEGCVNLNSIIMPNVKEIPNNAFKGCINLNDIDLSYCTSIGASAFKECKNLQKIELYDCSSIGESAFEGCVNLNSIIMPNVKEIPNNAFKGCINLNDIDLSYCTSIGASAFKECKNLQKIELYDCSSIGNYAFSGCTELKKVYIYKTDSVITLGTNVFGGDSDDDNIIFYIHPDIFDDYEDDSNWDGYNKVKMVQNNQIIYTTTNNDIIGNINDNEYTNKYENGYGLIEFEKEISTLNSNIFGNLIDGSDSDSYSDSNYLKTVELPESCKNIEDNAFNGCENLSDIKLSNSLEEIGNFAFQNCKSLTSFTIPQSIKTLGEGIFAGCSSITKFNGKFVTYDGKSIVYNKTLICVLPSYDKMKLNISTDINSSISILGKKCFYGCENLRRIDIPSNITEIHDNAFEGCENLREVHFHGNLPTIGNKIFGDIIRDDFKIFIPEDKLIQYYNNGKGNLGYYSEYIYPMPAANSLICYITKLISNLKTESKTNPFLEENADYKTYYKTSNSFKITNISSDWFKDNFDVKCVILGEKITGIDNFAFQNCENLTYIYLPDGITYLGRGCFRYCSELTKIHIPYNNPAGVATNIFEGCASLKEFGTYNKNRVSEDGRCYIYNNRLIFFAQGGSFSNSNNEYVIPDSVKEIGSYVFDKFKISKIILSDNIKKIGEFAFSNSELEEIDWGESVEIETISEYAFYNCASLTSITIPDSVTTIGDYAFRGCSSLTSITIPDSVTEIGNYAFYNCTALTSLNLSSDSNLETIGNYAFYNCTALTSLNLSSAINLETIGNYAFYNCTQLSGETQSSEEEETQLIISNGISSIGNNCFRKTGIKELIISSNTLESISSNAFRDCESLISVDITEDSLNLIEIGYSAFESCGSLESVTLSPQNLIRIGGSAFKDCGELKNIAMGSSIENISSYAFYNCKSLNSFIPPGSFININDISKQLPNSIKNIDNYAFYNCNRLWDITLPENLLTLGTYCFGSVNDDYGTSNLLNIRVPEALGLTPPSFNSSSSLPFGDPASSNKLHFLSIYVPTQHANRYKSDQYWSKYKNNINVTNRFPNNNFQDNIDTVLPRL